MSVKEILNNLTDIVADVTEYSKLTHVLDIARNKFREPERKFGVIPRGVSETSGVTNQITQDYMFSIILTDTYISTNLTDDALIEKTVDLVSDFDEIYKECVNTKCRSSDIVMLVNQFNVNEAVIVEEEKTIIVEGFLTIRINNRMR